MATPELYWSIYGETFGHPSLEEFQRFAGLPVSGRLDLPTVAMLHAPRCGVSDALRSTLDARWRKNRLTYVIETRVGGMSASTFDDIMQAAWKSWSDVAGLHFTRVASVTQADLVLSTGRGPRAGFDGRSGTLAWAQLPNGADQPLLMRFDLDEEWNTEIQLENVACHEFGHLLGLDHDAQASGSLMAPFYARALSKPQANDVRRIQAYYGPPVQGPAPPQPPPPVPPKPPGGSMTREIVTAIVSVVLGAVASRLPSFLGRWVLGLQDTIVEFIMRRFVETTELQPLRIDLEAAIDQLAEEIGKPPAEKKPTKRK